MKTVAIIQARMGSIRLPGKVMMPVVDHPLIEVLLARLQKSRKIDQIVLATPTGAENDKLCQHVETLGFEIFRGSEDDVLQRYYRAALKYNAETIVRITGDCPLIDHEVVDDLVDHFHAANADYASNCHPPSYPEGLDAEVFSFETLARAYKEAREPYDREHVTSFMRKGKFTTANLCCPEDFSEVRLSVDEPEDLQVVNRVFDHFSPRMDFGFQELIKLLHAKPDDLGINSHIPRNEGATMNQGQKLWRRAGQIIPGGSMLLSKKAELHLPEAWPSYFSKTQGCKLWDLDGREFTDVYLMGVGTNILGYSHPEVDAAVVQTVERGNLSTLNAPEEVLLAERLLELDPWAGMVRLARSGGEANAVAVRIARAAAGRDGVAVCGYHGWHDWYLSANLGGTENLAGHLLPGLEPTGVPKALAGLVHPFEYNDFAALQHLVDSHEIGVIKMEVMRNQEPRDDFLQKVRKLASERNIVLVFDECTSGFRETFGGLHKKFGVEPDMAVYGKTLGNGYAITAVVGREDIMRAAEASFISSTFWTERIGPTAALKALEVMEREESWSHATEIGLYLRQLWSELAARHGLALTFQGIPALSTFAFEGDNHLAYKTLITQEMLKKGYLAGTAVYASLPHTRELLDAYIEALDPVFGLIRTCEDGQDVAALLDGPVCGTGFGRMN